MTELLPCPFCGGEIELDHHEAVEGPEECAGECIECGCCDKCDEFWSVEHQCPYQNGGYVEIYLGCFDSEAEAIEAWNSRAATTIGKVQVEIEPVSRGTLTAEQVRAAIFNGSAYASYDGSQYYANGIDMQAIADELNNRAERTCVLLDRGKFMPHHEFYRVECNKCGVLFWQSHGHLPRAQYCPGCGARVLWGVVRND